jgi:diguanylate cyclase (GGDEF)-like protein
VSTAALASSTTTWLTAAWREKLPHGRSLPAGKFAARHARLRRLLWLHVVAVPLLSVLADGHSLLHDVSHAGPIAAFAVASGIGRNSRLQAVCVAIGLLTASAMVVHAAHGATEAHFHFFVTMSVLAMYEDWLPYGLGVAFVFVHHAILGAVAPVLAFGHDGNPIRLAAIHAAFIMAAGVANVALWRSNERARAVTAAALRRMELQYEVTRVLAAAVTLNDAVPQLLRLIGGRLGFSVGLLWMVDADGHTLRPTRTWVADEALEPVIGEYRDTATLRGGEGVVGRAWELGHAVTSEQLPRDTRRDHRALVASMRQQSAIALPIISGARTAGILAFTREAPQPTDPETTELLDSLSRQLALFMDRVDRAEQAAAFEDAAMTDALTNLPNRRAWDRALHDQLAWAERQGRPFALALIDLDHFKRFNDTRGHQAGDAMLAETADAWRGAVRAQDVLARYGGEEFALAMPGCDLEDAEEIVERLRRRVPQGQTCSIGLARWEPNECARELVARADEALYAAKAAGRDRVALAETRAAAA